MIVGVDIGTTAVKALLVDDDGKVARQAGVEIPAYQPAPGRHEQDPAEAWRAFTRAVRMVMEGADQASVSAICFSAAMHGLLPLDERMNPLSRQITWADGRAARQAARIRDEIDPHYLYLRTGCPAQPLYYPARLSWMKEEAPDLFAAARFCSIKEWILYRLTGRLVMDRGIASSIGLLDLQNLEWDGPALDLCGIDPGRLPELVSPQSVIEGLAAGPASELGLSPRTLVVPGSGDGGLANLGSGAVEPGQAAATIGTSGAMRVVSDRPLVDPRERTWCYLLTDGAWYAGGAINSGGVVYRFIRDSLYPDAVEKAAALGVDPYEIINREAAQASAVSPLIFLPYIMGERTPHWNPNARGVVFGLTPGHGRAHIARAAMEGSAFAMYAIFRALQPQIEISEIRASGGFLRSELWVKILADALGAPVIVPQSMEGSAMGAAFLAMRATGRIREIAEVRQMAPAVRAVEPDPALHEYYDRAYRVFEDIYPGVAGLFDRLLELGPPPQRSDKC